MQHSTAKQYIPGSPPSWFVAALASTPPTPAQVEARKAHSLACRLDHAHLHLLQTGAEPEQERSAWPDGYGPGQTLGDRAQWRAVASFVDGASA